ncbi:MAG: CHASE2 domain-containing protein [Pyrinomonadaceae bacterium]
MRQQGDTRSRPHRLRRAKRALGLVAIVTISAAAGVISASLAPGVDRYARDLLVRVRGPVAPPDDIVIVAIDESSIKRLGRFPWQRGETARAIDVIAAAQPKVIALDVLYSEPTKDADDSALAESIARSGRTIVAAQIVKATDRYGERRAEWLRPLALIEHRAAGVGHINVSTESDGVSRELPLRKADDKGQSLWSIAVEAIRVGEGLRVAEVQDIPGGVQLGRRTLPIASDEDLGANIAPQEADGRVVQLRSKPMLIDYIGPAGSFASRTYSFVDVLEGKVPAEEFRGKYVLVGATAATLGDHVASPFVHSEDASGDQHGTLMPGVEVLANAVNTILRGRFYRETPDWLALFLSALVAAAAVVTLTLAQGRFEAFKQVSALVGLVTLILAVCYLVFTRWVIFPPVVPALMSLVTATPLTLLLRSLATSADLDERIAELSLTNKWLVSSAREPSGNEEPHSNPATLIARLTEASAVGIFARERPNASAYKIVAAAGTPNVVSLSKDELLQAAPLAVQVGSGTSVQAEADANGSGGVSLSHREMDERNLEQLKRTLILRLGDPEDPSGALLITHQPISADRDVLRLCAELAASYVRRIAINEFGTEAERLLSRCHGGWRLPRGIEWKARALAVLQRRMMARARFVDRALRSVEDGLIVSDVDGRILFANPRAAEIFGVTERALAGSDLFSRIAGDGNNQDNHRLTERARREILVRLVVERQPVERGIVIGDAPPRYYTLRLSAVTDEEDGALPGLVASLSDVTKQHELQQTKNDVMALVTHELRTPLTAIQGMSELLAEHEVEPARRRQMQLAINEEAKRLARLINDYLDLARLESGARPLRLSPARVAPLIERVLLMLEPLAEERGMRITRRFAPNLPPVFVDADLLAQAVTNLVANAIKYSPAGNEVVVKLHANEGALWIEVADHGHGIPVEAIPRIFEKFCRVPRIEDADVSGTGLGLAFVREMAEKHGGRIIVKSKVGMGSVFSLRLPLPRKSESD